MKRRRGSRDRQRFAAEAGLCGYCLNRRLVTGARSTFIRCALAARDEAFERYPRLPVVECAGFEAEQPAGGEEEQEGE